MVLNCDKGDFAKLIFPHQRHSKDKPQDEQDGLVLEEWVGGWLQKNPGWKELKISDNFGCLCLSFGRLGQGQ